MTNKKNFIALVLMVAGGITFAKSYSVTNTFGGSTEDLEGQDLFTLGRTYNPEKNVYTLNNSDMHVADRIQLEAGNEVIETKIRLDLFNFENVDYEEGVFPGINLKGYGLVNFNDYVSMTAGNGFFSRFEIKAAELFAMDTLPDSGKILRNGAGIFGTIPFDKKAKTKLNAGAGLEYTSDFSDIKNLKADFGASFIVKKNFSVGVSAHSFTAGEFGKYGIFASKLIGDDIKINAGFIYNNSDKDVLLRETKYSVQLSGKYTNDDLRFQVAADVISGLNSEYLSGKTQETLKYEGNGIPFAADLDVAYFVTDKVKAAVNVMYQDLLNTKGNYLCQVYPNIGYSSKKGKYSVNGGVKLFFEQTTVKGLTRVSVPVVCKVEFSD